jgi:hypothetical protein
MTDATFTEQVLMLAGVVVIVALVSFLAAMWWTSGRYEQLLDDAERDGLRRAQGAWRDGRAGLRLELAASVARHPARGTEPVEVTAARVEAEDQALAIANSGATGEGWVHLAFDEIDCEPSTVSMPHIGDMSVTEWTRAQAEELTRWLAANGIPDAAA